jgi:5-methyltetrahydropteroyltriglutamate--homocysteine methyltransferase
VEHTVTELRTIRADHVGGLPRPWELRERQAAFERGEITAEAREETHRQVVAELLDRQVEVGLSVLTDGEVSRRNFQESFGGSVSGFDVLPYAYDCSPVPPAQDGAPLSHALPTARAFSGMAESGPPILHRRPVRERLELVHNVVLDEYKRASSLSGVPVKVTLIGPDRISQRFAHEDSKDVYPNLDAFVADVLVIERAMISQLVEAGCRYVQIDEPGYTAYVDPPSLEQMRARGEDPETNLARGIAADNTLIAGFVGVTFGVHICRGGGGGRGGMWFHRERTYDAIAERLYGELNFDRFREKFSFESALFLRFREREGLKIVFQKSIPLRRQKKVKASLKSAGDVEMISFFRAQGFSKLGRNPKPVLGVESVFVAADEQSHEWTILHYLPLYLFF